MGDARTRLCRLFGLVGREAKVLLTRRGQAVAPVVSAAAKPDRARALAAVERARRRRKGVTLGGIGLKELIDEGRR